MDNPVILTPRLPTHVVAITRFGQVAVHILSNAIRPSAAHPCSKSSHSNCTPPRSEHSLTVQRNPDGTHGVDNSSSTTNCTTIPNTYPLHHHVRPSTAHHPWPGPRTRTWSRSRRSPRWCGIYVRQRGCNPWSRGYRDGLAEYLACIAADGDTSLDPLYYGANCSHGWRVNECPAACGEAPGDVDAGAWRGERGSEGAVKVYT